MNNAIEIKGLCKNYSDFSLKNIDMAIPKGYITGFVGGNGAGKSTTIKSILNLINKDSGKITVFGTDHTQLSKRQKEMIGVVYDECVYPSPLKIKQIDKFSKNIYSNWDSSKFMELCKKFRLPDDKIIQDFSRGMKMKLSIAAALCHGAKLLILDEATSGLDPVVRDEILDMLLDFIQDEENTIFISSHITSDLEKVADYITFINNGEIVMTIEKDRIDETFAILKCSEDKLEKVDKTAIVGISKNKYGVSALVYREKVNTDMVMDKASIEDILLYIAREAE